MLLTSYLDDKIFTFFIRNKTADFLLFNINTQQKNIIFFAIYVYSNDSSDYTHNHVFYLIYNKTFRNVKTIDQEVKRQR